MSVDHYENFPVASVLCPPQLREPILAIYGYARTADDLADEGDALPAQRLADLAAYEADLLAVRDGGQPSLRWAGVFHRLARAIAEHRLPMEPLLALLSAFKQDVTQHHHSTREQLLDYCSRSANPVGRLLLHLHGVSDALALRQSDAICAALQLNNFWQDVSVDARNGRVYLPKSDLARHGLTPLDVGRREKHGALGLVLQELCDWTEGLMQQGAPLVHRLPGRSGWELRFVVQGGLQVLAKVRHLGSELSHRRPRLHLFDGPALAWRAARMSWGSAAPARQTT